jgi:hypothetical protein
VHRLDAPVEGPAALVELDGVPDTAALRVGVHAGDVRVQVVDAEERDRAADQHSPAERADDVVPGVRERAHHPRVEQFVRRVGPPDPREELRGGLVRGGFAQLPDGDPEPAGGGGGDLLGFRDQVVHPASPD